MAKHCSCGADLPAGAEFCPMCGRPLRAPARGELNPIAEAPRQEAAELPKISMGDPDVVRSAWPVGALAAFLASLPVVSIFCFVWYPLAGFLTVARFRKRTGRYATTAEGARLGWVTGLFAFGITLVLSALASVLPASEGGVPAAIEQMRKQVEESPAGDDMKQRMIELIENPTAFAFMMIFAIVISFAVTVGFTTLGGALGAKVLDKE